MASSSLRIAGLVPDSIVDGPGLRFSVFVQGCTHGCPGCHNPESQDPQGGSEYTLDEIVSKVRSNELIGGVTISGGEPFQQPEAVALLVKTLADSGYDIWVYTGYLYEDLQAKASSDTHVATILNTASVLVDGPYIDANRTWDLPWRGSSNQRLIDLKASAQAGQVVLWRDPNQVEFKRPPSW